MFENKISLYENFFTDGEKTIVSNGEMTASVFRYSTGVCAVTVKNKNGYITMLPFKGQQIWRAEFDGHPLVMRTMFDEPQQTDDFLKTYGAFMLHCGLTAIGNPSREDTHPLHGELPNAHYQKAYLISGEDEKGRYITVSGEFEYRIGFDTGYKFVPEVKLYENGTTFFVTDNLMNLRGNPQEYLYLCHINFRPVDGAKLIYSAKPGDIYTHVVVPDNMPKEEKEELKKYFAALKKDITIHDKVDNESQYYRPEIVFTVKYKTDENGKGYCMQLLPDGYACFISHNPEQLPYGIRWISRTDDEDAMGMLLPATGEHNGYKDCMKKGYIRHIEPYGTVKLDFEVGLLRPESAEKVKEKIASILK